MDEIYVKQKLAELLLSKEKISSYRLEDKFRAGVPDMLVARSMRTLWIEAKYSEWPYLPWRWKAYKAHQSESMRRISLITGIPSVYYCRNQIGDSCIASIKAVVQCIESKASLDRHFEAICVDARDIPFYVGKILDGEVKFNA